MKNNFKRLILGTTLIKGLKRKMDKSVPKGLKDYEVERGYTKRPPIPYIPVEDEVGELVPKVYGASEYKLELPGRTKVQHALWESGSVEAFLKHVISTMSYVTRKCYFKEYEEAKREAGKAVYDAKNFKDLWMAAEEPPEGTTFTELEALREAEIKVIEKNLNCVEVAGKMCVLYKNLLSKNARSKWSTIIRGCHMVDLGHKNRCFNLTFCFLVFFH